MSYRVGRLIAKAKEILRMLLLMLGLVLFPLNIMLSLHLVGLFILVDRRRLLNIIETAFVLSIS